MYLAAASTNMWQSSSKVRKAYNPWGGLRRRNACAPLDEQKQMGYIKTACF